MKFEPPDGTPYRLDTDFYGNRRPTRMAPPARSNWPAIAKRYWYSAEPSRRLIRVSSEIFVTSRLYPARTVG